MPLSHNRERGEAWFGSNRDNRVRFAVKTLPYSYSSKNSLY